MHPLINMNIIIKNSNWDSSDIDSIFNNEDVKFIDVTTMEDLCLKVGAYESKSKARHAGRFGKIPSGYNEIRVNKKTFVYLWNPALALTNDVVL